MDDRFENLLQISDYSIALKEELDQDIANLSHYSSSNVESSLDDVNKKIDLARKFWVNVDALDKQILDFRVILFKRDIENKIEDVNKNYNEFTSNIDRIEKEYFELKKENIDQNYLSQLMSNLHSEVSRSKIKFMVVDILNTESSSLYTLDNIANEIAEAKKDWINVDDIEEEIFA